MSDKKRKDRVVRTTSQFRADLKRAGSHRKFDPKALRRVMGDIAARAELDPALLDHPLRGRIAGVAIQIAANAM